MNLGWVAREVNADSVLSLDLSAPSIQGMLREPPRVGLRLGEVSLDGDAWPKSLPYLDMEAIEIALKMDLAEQILMSTDATQDGFVQDWSLQNMPPEKHRAYALQWFSMAAAIVIILIVLNRRVFMRKGKSKHE